MIDFHFGVQVDLILGRYPKNYKQAAIIPLLDLAQRQGGGLLTLAAMDKVAKIVDVDEIRVYEVATFYTMFNRTRVGKYYIQLCGTTPCMICGSEEIKHTIEEYLDIKEGETTADGLFTLREVECMGTCANAPMIQLNDDYYECLTKETTIALLEACKAGNPPKMGKWGSLPMNGQVSCEGPLGKTSLFDIPMNMDALMRKDDVLSTGKVSNYNVKYMCQTYSHCCAVHAVPLSGQSSGCEEAHGLLNAEHCNKARIKFSSNVNMVCLCTT